MESKELVETKEEESKKMKKKDVYLISAILIAAISMIVVGFLVNNTNPEYPVVYIQDGEARYWSGSSSKNALDMDASEVESLVVKYSEKNTDEILFLEGTTLCLLTISDNQKYELAENVITFFFDKTGENVIYQDENHNVYRLSNIKGEVAEEVILELEEDKIAIVSLLENNKLMCEISDELDGMDESVLDEMYIGYYQDSYVNYAAFRSEMLMYYGESYDKTLYIYDLETSETIEIVQDAKELYLSKDESKILYEVANDDSYTFTASVYEISSDEHTKIAEDVVEIYADEDYTEFYYLVEAEDAIYEIIEDDRKEEDEEAERTEVEVKYSIEEYYAGLCTYEQVENEETYIVYEAEEDVMKNDEIRNALEYTKPYEVRYNKDGEDRLVKEKVLEVASFNESTGTMICTVIDEEETVKISSLEKIEDFYVYLEGKLGFAYIKDFNQVDLGNLEGIMELILDVNDDVYYVNGDGELFVVEVEDEGVKETYISNEVAGTMNNPFTNDMYYVKTSGVNYDLYSAEGQKSLLVAEKIYTFKFDGETMYVFQEVADNAEQVQMSKYSDGNLEVITENLEQAIILEDDSMYFLRNYSEETGLLDIYYYNKGTETEVVSDIVFGLSSLYYLPNIKIIL